MIVSKKKVLWNPNEFNKQSTEFTPQMLLNIFVYSGSCLRVCVCVCVRWFRLFVCLSTTIITKSRAFWAINKSNSNNNNIKILCNFYEFALSLCCLSLAYSPDSLSSFVSQCARAQTVNYWVSSICIWVTFWVCIVYQIITPVARRKNSLFLFFLQLFKFIITKEMCASEFNFENKQVLIFTQCLLAFLLAQLVWPPSPYSLETNKNNTHTHTRKQQLLRFLSSPLTIFPLFSLYSIVSTTTTTTTRASPTTTAKIIIFLNCEALREFFFSVFQFFLLFMYNTRARENNNKRR